MSKVLAAFLKNLTLFALVFQNVVGAVADTMDPSENFTAETMFGVADESDAYVFSRQQNIRQSTLPILILSLVSVAFIVAFKVFLLLWKVTYYSVLDPYEISEPTSRSLRILRNLEPLVDKSLTPSENRIRKLHGH